MYIIFPIVVFFLNTSGSPVSTNFVQPGDKDTIFLIKNHWHTGIVLKTSDVITFCPELMEFQQFKYIDIGWGDEEFYQYPDFDLGLAVKALFYPTPSALRIEGITFSIERYIELSDMAVMINVTDEQLKKIAGHISETFYKNIEGKTSVLSSRYGGNIRFYKAVGEYHLFNTCNTWIADCLEDGGIDFGEHVILAEQLFKLAADKGKVLKAE